MAISRYLACLREKIGHDLVLAPSVAVIARDDLGRVLMVKAGDTGMWQTVGGMVEPDETPEQAARREAREETGLNVELLGILAVMGGPRFRHTYPNGDQMAYVATVFDARVTDGELRPDGDEVTAARQSLELAEQELPWGRGRQSLRGRRGSSSPATAKPTTTSRAAFRDFCPYR